MKKPSYLCTVTVMLCGCLALIGCTPTKVIIPSLKYQDNIGLHIDKVAHVHWVPGKRVSSERPSYHAVGSSGGGGGGLSGLVVGLIAGSIETHQRKNHPSEYNHEYGKADETVFITSLRDVLVQQSVFKKVELATDLSKVSEKDVLIKVYFKTARVVDVDDVKLTVNLLIQTGHHSPFERTYLVQNDPPEGFKGKTFLDKKTEVSQKLLTEIISGIKQWQKENK